MAYQPELRHYVEQAIKDGYEAGTVLAAGIVPRIAADRAIEIFRKLLDPKSDKDQVLGLVNELRALDLVYSRLVKAVDVGQSQTQAMQKLTEE